MIKKIRISILSAAMMLGMMAAPLAVSSSIASAACSGTECLKNGSNATTEEPGKQPTLQDNIKVIVNVLLFIIGIIAVIMIIIGGIRYTTSNGDQAQLTSAKNTILYAIVGIIIAILAYAIVNFVISSFIKP